MNIGMGKDQNGDDFAGGNGNLYFDETKLKLSDIWEESGKARKDAVRNGQVASLYYLYDFGVSAPPFSIAQGINWFTFQDNWDHKIDFVSSSMVSREALKVAGATGCSPLDDSGGVTGWEEVRQAFFSANPTVPQKQRKSWAMEISPLGPAFDPSKAPNLGELNMTFTHLCGQEEVNGEDRRNPSMVPFT
jgi:hypothetical protein